MSYYGTCCLSNLPIPWQTPALLFVLGQGDYNAKKTVSGFCSPTGLWRPLGPPFRGLYNDDRGLIDVVPDRVRIEAGWRDQGRKPDEPVDKFLERIRDGHVKCQQGNRVSPVGMTLVRADVWQQLLEMKWQGYHEPLDRDAHYRDARNWLTHIVTLQMTDYKAKNFAYGFEVEQHFTSRRSLLYSGLYDCGGVGNLPFGLERNGLTRGVLDGIIAKEAALALLYELADVMHVTELMCPLRRAWQPMTGLGSQDIEWDTHLEFMERMSDITKTAKEANC